MPLNTPLTRELDRQRLRRDWMADKLGVKPWTFSRIEAGVRTPPPAWYERAAAFLGVPVETIRPEAEAAEQVAA